MDREQKKAVLAKMAGMKDAPNYRATTRLERRCKTCKDFKGKEGGSVGKCSRFQFLASANSVCGAWRKKGKGSSF